MEKVTNGFLHHTAIRNDLDFMNLLIMKREVDIKIENISNTVDSLSNDSAILNSILPSVNKVLNERVNNAKKIKREIDKHLNYYLIL